MPENCDPNVLAQNARCFKCLPNDTLQQVQTYLLCNILNNGGTGGGGGGTGTVTSFSAGDLVPLFTTTETNPTTTPALTFALNTQAANLFFAGPTAGGAVAPTFRALVNADFGTTLTPQFARLGLGKAANATIILDVLKVGAAGFQEVVRFDTGVGSPYCTVGNDTVPGLGGLFGFDRGTLEFFMAPHFSTTQLRVNAAGDATANSFSANNFNAAGGYATGGNAGLNQTFNVGGGDTQIQFIGGIATAIS